MKYLASSGLALLCASARMQDVIVNEDVMAFDVQQSEYEASYDNGVGYGDTNTNAAADSNSYASESYIPHHFHLGDY